MNISGITYPDVNNGTGCRVTLWVSGCVHHCKGCHNQETWDFNHGRVFDSALKKQLFDILSKKYIKGLTLSGGDPLCSYDDVLKLIIDVKNTFPDKDIWLFTGFTKGFIDNHYSKILDYVDFIVDGKYIEEERDVSLAFRGSRNQRIWKKYQNGDFEVINDTFFQSTK